jgi:hypothetical protein
LDVEDGAVVGVVGDVEELKVCLWLGLLIVDEAPFESRYSFLLVFYIFNLFFELYLLFVVN